MKIAVISPYAHIPGHHWANAVQLAKALQQSKHQVVLICSVPPISGIEPDLEVPVVVVCPSLISKLMSRLRDSGDEYRRNSLRQNLETAFCMAAAFKYGSRGFHLHFIDARLYLLSLFVVFSRQRVSALLGGGFPFSTKQDTLSNLRYRRRFAKWLLKVALSTGRLAFNCETDNVRDEWREHFPNARITTIPVSVEVTESGMTRRQARHALGLPQNKPVFLIFGTHRQDKDYHTVIRAAQALEGMVHLLFAGPLISANDPARIARELNYSEISVTSGFLSDEVVAQCFTACDATVMPYPADFNRGSVVLVQSVAYNRPVIASRAVSFVKFFEQYSIGLLFDCGNVETLAEHMDRFRSDSKEPFALDSLKPSLSQVSEKYSWRTILNTYQAYFKHSS